MPCNYNKDEIGINSVAPAQGACSKVGVTGMNDVAIGDEEDE